VYIMPAPVAQKCAMPNSTRQRYEKQPFPPARWLVQTIPGHHARLPERLAPRQLCSGRAVESARLQPDQAAAKSVTGRADRIGNKDVAPISADTRVGVNHQSIRIADERQ
jgi:hypothetical protein